MQISEHLIYANPTPEKVAQIVDAYGIDAAMERWHWIEERTLCRYAQVGRARSGGIATARLGRRRYSPLDAAVLVESAYALGSAAAGDRAAGLPKSTHMIVISGRGLTPPAFPSAERVRRARVSVRANKGDPDAIAERDRHAAFELAVGDVVRRALQRKGMAWQPPTGRYVMPEPSAALAHALAGCDPDAVALVFLSLDFPPSLPSSLTSALEEDAICR